MKKERNEFVKAMQVIPLHIERYNRQIDRLLSVQMFSEEDYEFGKVKKQQYYRQRNKKIKAYSDAVDTMIQKERLLQFHTSGFNIKITEEKTEIHIEAKSKYNLDLLSHEEKVELLRLYEQAKKQQSSIPSVSYNNQQQGETIDIPHEEVKEPANVTQIKQIEAPIITEFTLKPVDPLKKLQENFNKLAAEKFREIGTVNDEERNLYELG